ncbi:MAG: radical SAM family heme chaperone HemW [Phycisphaerae bacterium]|nr:radical SAM family heme chaperone HemW [Phycisphaerae bacterium]
MVEFDSRLRVHERDNARDAVRARGEGVSPLCPCRAMHLEEQGQDALATAGLYVHVPFCRSKCRYCGFYSVPVAGRETGRLVAALMGELDRYDGVEFCTAYVGGGSPSALPVDQLVGLVRRVAGRLAPGGEFTVECNPGQVDAELLAGLRGAGVHRLSFGAQSFRPAELELLGRGHTVDDIGRAVELARGAGFDNLGLDLIFAIPGSTLADWQYSVEAALDLGVQHISAYSLSFEPGTVFDAWRRAGRLCAVDEELDRAMYEWAIERLGRAGLEQYEISNFARPRFECRHNLGYWANRPFVGIGPGAASSSTGILPVVQNAWAGRPCYAQGSRTTNEPDIERYVAAVESGGEVPGEVQPVGWEDAICETAVLNLRMRTGIDLAAFQARTGHDVIRTFAEPIRRYRDLGLIEVTDRSVRLTEQALPIADSVLCDFAALE